MPRLSHHFHEFYMKQYHYVGHTFSKSEQNQFLTNPPVQYGHNYSIHHIHLSMQERAHTNQSVEQTPATAHSGTYTHTNQSVDNIQQQLTLVHTNTNICNTYCTYMYTTYTHIQSTLSVGTLNSSLECIHTEGWRSS